MGMCEEAQTSSSDMFSTDTVSQGHNTSTSSAFDSGPSKPAVGTSSPMAETETAVSTDKTMSPQDDTKEHSGDAAADKLQLQFGSFGKADDAGSQVTNEDKMADAERTAEETVSSHGSKAGGELRVDAAEFVPGQWDKPKQGELPGTLDKSGSQQSLSFQTDDASALQGSDAAANEYAQADYSQQYYTAQGWTWSEQYQQYGVFGYDESGLYRWYPAPPIEEWAGSKGKWGRNNGGGQPGGFYMAERTGRAQRQRGQQQRQQGGQPPAPPPRQAPRQLLAKPITAADRKGAPSIAAAKRPRKEAARSLTALREAYGADAVAEAGLAILEQQFPAYSRAALKEIYEAAGGDVSSALDSLSSLEAEHSKGRTSIRPEKTQAIALDEENFPVLQSPARPKQASWGPRPAKTSPEKTTEELHERPRSPVSILNQAPSATPSPAPTSAAELHSGHASPVKAADCTSSDTGTDASLPHQAPQAAASTCSEGEEPAAPGAQEGGQESHSGDAESQEDVASSGKAAPEEGAALEEPAAKATDEAPEEAAAQTETESADAKAKEEAPQKQRYVPAEAPAVSAWGRSSKLLFEPSANGGPEKEPAAKPSTASAQPAASNGQESAVVVKKAAGGRKGPQREAPWVLTGAVADAQYSAARRDAKDHMRMRNTFFQQATQAYLEGDKALAKKLGANGRWHAAEMLKAHQAASENIFHQRNPSPRGKAGGLPVIDLHGQHVNEALRIVERELAHRRAHNNGKARSTQILVGTLNHSKAKHSVMRLAEAVENLLQKESIPFSKPVPGVLEIEA